MSGIIKGQASSPIEFEVKPTVTGESEVLLRNEIVGTVSEAAGVPTGAIIQRGSNANGEFVRYADGTQICWSPKSIQATRAAGEAWALSSGTLPADFVGNVTYSSTDIVAYTTTAKTRLLYTSLQTYDESGVVAINTGRSPTNLFASFTTLGTESAALVDYIVVSSGRWF